jgi:hypothetical protein
MSYLNTDMLPADDDLRSPRRSQLIRASIVDSGHRTYPIVIRNVSKSGIGGIAPGNLLQKGEGVVVQFREDKAMEGTVAWVDGDRFGVRMRFELDLEFLTDMIRQKQATTSDEGAWEVRRIHRVQAPQPKKSGIRRI